MKSHQRLCRDFCNLTFCLSLSPLSYPLFPCSFFFFPHSLPSSLSPSLSHPSPLSSSFFLSFPLPPFISLHPSPSLSISVSISPSLHPSLFLFPSVQEPFEINATDSVNKCPTVSEGCFSQQPVHSCLCQVFPGKPFPTFCKSPRLSKWTTT